MFFTLQRKPPLPRPKACNPTLILDLDGVLAPFHSIPEHTPHHVITSNPYMTWTVPTHLHQWLQHLTDEGINIIWASTWEAEANLLSRALMLPEYPHLKLPANSDNWGKLPSVRNYIHKRASYPATVWVDDELTADAKGWASTIPNLLTVTPDSRTGLTPEQTQHISRHLLPSRRS